MSETDNIRAALRTKLREINNDNPLVIREEIIAEWESQTGKRLYPAQSDNFLLNELAAREARVKTQINEAVLQQYARTAEGVFLDEIGAFWGNKLKRLEEIRIDEDGNEYLYIEDDERLRRRILLAPEGTTSAGTVGAYTFHALSSDLAIIDVDISTPDDGAGNVHITVLGDGSKSIDDLCNTVYHAITADNVRVLCVNYTVSGPIDIPYVIQAEIVIYKSYSARDVNAEAVKAAEAYTKNPRKHQSIDNVNSIEEVEDHYKRLGIDIVGSQIIEAIHSVAGVYQVNLVGFPESGVISIKSGDDYSFGELMKIAEIGVCERVTVNIVGVANE